MKRTTLILAGLMMLGSTAAFAEGGAERMHYLFETLHTQSNASASKTTEVRVPNDQTAQVTEHYKP